MQHRGSAGRGASTGTSNAVRETVTHAVLSAFLGETGASFPAPRASIDYDAAYRRVLLASNPRAALGLRLARWLVAWSPLWACFRVRTLRGLPLAERARLVSQLLSHRWFVVRELTLLLKFVAALALFANPEVRALSHYDALDRHDAEPSRDRSGERLRLPVLDRDAEDVA